MGPVTSDCVSVFVTCGTQGEAHSIARTLVEEGLAACVNILPGVTSVYRWEGQVQAEPEVVLLVKTQQSVAERVCARVEQLHSYDVPCAVIIPLAGGSKGYLEWIRANTAGG